MKQYEASFEVMSSTGLKKLSEAGKHHAKK